MKKNVIKALLYRNSSFFDVAILEEKKPKAKSQENYRLDVIKGCNIFIKFKDINKSNVVIFNKLLISRQYSTNYIKSLIYTLSKHINKAVEDGYLTKNPIVGYKIIPGIEKSPIRSLTEKELKILKNKEFDHPSKQFCSDIFVFQCHTGLSYCDMITLQYSDIKRSSGNWIEGERGKNGSKYLIPVDPTALRIVRKYRKTFPRLRYKKTNKQCVFPYISRNGYRAILCRIGKEIGITDMFLSSHKGRHTFATRMLTKGVTIESIKKMLGHRQNSDITWLYAEIQKEKIRRETKF